MKTVLVIEDNAGLRGLVREYLEAHGLGVRLASNGREGLFETRHHPPDLIILDLMMPQVDGLTFLKSYRVSGAAPVLILTARDSESDKVLGLEAGADDYVTKPFSVAELLARVRAHLRRAERPEGAEVLRCGPLNLNLRRRVLKIGEQPVDLTRSEFALLRLLMSAPERVYSRLDLMSHIQEDSPGPGGCSERTIDVHVRNLRVKIEPDPARPRWLETVYGIGYRFNPGADG